MIMQVDQAENLRKMVQKKARGVDLGFNNITASLFGNNCPVFVFLGEKTELVSFCSIVVNLAVEISKPCRKILLMEDFDETINCAVLIGANTPPAVNCYDNGNAVFQQIAPVIFNNITLMRGVSEFECIDNWKPQYRFEFVNNFKRILGKNSELMMINEIYPHYSMVCSDVIAVFSPRQEHIVSMYKRLKMIRDINPDARLYFIINNADSVKQIEQVSKKFQTMLKEFIGVNSVFLGGMILFSEVIRSIKAKKPLSEYCTYSRAAGYIKDIAVNILREMFNRSTPSTRFY